MTKPIPQVQKFMTTSPMSVEKTENLLVAAELMQKNHIRHLPVVHDGKIEGILSSTDVNLIRTLKNAKIEELRVLDCFTPNAFTVKPNAPLNEVMDEMAEKKYGCVVVSDNQKLVGIFTWIDALRASSELLETRLK
jgi:acetoin utilization protein AcuB